MPAKVVPDDAPAQLHKAIGHPPRVRMERAIEVSVPEDVGREDNRRAVAQTEVGDFESVAGFRVLETWCHVEIVSPSLARGPPPSAARCFSRPDPQAPLASSSAQAIAACQFLPMSASSRRDQKAECRALTALHE